MFDLLGLPGVKPVDLRPGQILTVVVELIEEQLPICPDCAQPLHRHGRRSSIFADTPMQMQPVRLEIMRPRYRCETCGKTVTPQLSFLDEKRRATKRLVDAIRDRCLGMTFHALALQTGLAVNTIKNIAHDLIAELERTVRYETPVIMGIDEVSLAGEYRCVVTNLATNNVFQILEFRTQEHLKPFFKNLPDRERVEWVCTDMWRPFKRSFSEYLPNARLVIDKFHVVKMASDALEDERKKYQATLTKDERLQVKKSIRWLTLKRPGNLSPAEKKALLVVRETIPALGLAYDVKEAFFRIYDEPDKESAMRAFEAWETALPDDDLPKFTSLAKTVHNHYDDIFAYWDSPGRITNAYTECLNGLIKLANRTGRGYSYEIIRAKTLYAKHARKVGSGTRLITTSQGAVPTKRTSETIEYGPHIPTLIDIAEAGGLD
ncbi:ISL3 family transposase [Actimicrobium sp. CCI2.3]|uniref:ISL3 family transposase n=1 Tax=Actimicrobium sp. CCI2.3 TaxID=3048616 RepID=UPI002AB3F4A4|nr:ISL3 family transposase [Actimicrobium sp. CCI2.3]MDY7576538.1 ISL3 family transposase [Actimicrobium sp. CCI2.3]MEB0023808.1 ISL3 family transposase [Actimicrobium sp. CCI2.3]